MTKVVFIPFSIVGGFAAGFAARRLFQGVWSLVDEQDPPEPSQPNAPRGKLLLAAALEGAVFSATRAAADHGARTAFRSLTGSWPG